MQGFEIKHFLSNNQWVGGAAVSSSEDDDGTGLIQVDLSAEGHRLICEQGMDVFTQKIHERLPSMYARSDCWEIRPLKDSVFEAHTNVPHFKLPDILSWINEASQHTLLLEVCPQMSIFEGHFPDNPILPGIVQLHWAVGISMGVYSFNDAPFEIKRLKFKNIVQPPRVLELVLKKPGANEINFQFSSPGQLHSMGCFVIGEEPAC